MRTREEIQDSVPGEECAQLDAAILRGWSALQLEVLLDIRDMLAKWSDGFIVDRVPPNYSRESGS